MEFTGERVIPGKTPSRIYEDHIERYKFALEYIKNKNVLDVACGTGYGSKCLLDGGALNVTGIDVSEEAISYAKTHYNDYRLTFLQGDATKLPFPDGYFDIIVSFETIEHIPNYLEYLSEVSRVLKVGGIYIVSTPNRVVTSPSKSLYQKPDNEYHFIEFELHEFESTLKKISLNDIDFYGQRMINKLFVNNFFRVFISRIMPKIYYNAKGSSKIIKIPRLFHVPRYIIAVCKK